MKINNVLELIMKINYISILTALTLISSSDISASPRYNIVLNDDAQAEVSVSSLLPNELDAITDELPVAEITVDREYYNIYWTITCSQDPDFFHGGSSAAAQAGAGCYVLTAFTPSSEPIILNGGNVYTFSFYTCEFGWDGDKFVDSFEVLGTGEMAEEFSDIQCLGIGCEPGVFGYPFQKQYTVTFDAPVTEVKAYSPMGMMGTKNFGVEAADEDGLAWIVNCSNMQDTEGGFELHIQARDLETGLRLKGNTIDNSFSFSIYVSNSSPDDDSAIQQITINQDAHTIYHMNGMISTPNNNGSTLSDGLYIIDGHKVIIAH